jgi:hypothetical protein
VRWMLIIFELNTRNLFPCLLRPLSVRYVAEELTKIELYESGNRSSISGRPNKSCVEWPTPAISKGVNWPYSESSHFPQFAAEVKNTQFTICRCFQVFGNNRNKSNLQSQRD